MRTARPLKQNKKATGPNAQQGAPGCSGCSPQYASLYSSTESLRADAMKVNCTSAQEPKSCGEPRDPIKKTLESV